MPPGILEFRAVEGDQVFPGQEDVDFQMGVGRQVAEHPTHFVIGFLIDAEHLAERIFITEIFAGGRFRHEGLVRLGNPLRRIAGPKFELQHLEQFRLGEEHPVFDKPAILIGYRGGVFQHPP